MPPSDLLIRPFDGRDQADVIALWQRCNLVAPTNDPRRDIALKLRVQRDLFLVGLRDGSIIATVMAGYDGHRAWINYLAVAPDAQRRGVGRRMMEAVETGLRQLGAPKINLQVRGTNAEVVEFYRHLGFSVEDRVSMGKRLT